MFTLKVIRFYYYQQTIESASRRILRAKEQFHCEEIAFDQSEYQQGLVPYLIPGLKAVVIIF